MKSILLMGIIKNSEKGLTTMTTGDAYSSYKSVCECIGQSILTQRRITGLIQELDMLGVVHARIKSNGRTGRTKDIIEMVKSDELFTEYKPPKQTTLI